MIVRQGSTASLGSPRSEERESDLPARIEARNLSKQFDLEGARLPVLDGITFHATAGEFVSIIGPSGCGKSTLFNILAGLIQPAAGSVMISGESVTGRLGLVGYMPQKDLLMPWKTVLDNTAIGMELRGISRREARRQAAGWFPRFGLAGFERQYPFTLSGGMRQRAALLRTILAGRDILLLDEPFGALDAITRIDMQEWLLDIWAQLDRTVVLVTHDVDEAIYLSDRVYVLSPRPARVEAVVDVPLPRPRDHDEIVTSPAFADLKHRLLASLRRQRGQGHL
jgi:ABC-type nitrate/sulfonate/bicarbonate transport system ATPase subunit